MSDELLPPDWLDELIESWPTGGLSEHMRLEIAASFKRAEPLGVGEAVPGCGCVTCTGVSLPKKPRARTAKDMKRAESWSRLVDRARGVGILETARRLGLTPRKAGKEHVARCPLHEDSHPSLRLNSERGVWFCHPCGEGGDGLRLWMRAKKADFVAAVRELAA